MFTHFKKDLAFLCDNKDFKNCSNGKDNDDKDNEILMLSMKALIVGKLGVAHSLLRLCSNNNLIASRLLNEIEHYCDVAHYRDVTHYRDAAHYRDVLPEEKSKLPFDAAEMKQMKIMINRLLETKKWSKTKVCEKLKLTQREMNNILNSHVMA